MFRDKIGNDGFSSFKRPTTIAPVDASTYDLQPLDDIIHVEYTLTGIVTITIPSDQSVGSNREFTIKDADGNAGTNNITVVTEGSEKIDNADTYIMDTNLESITLYLKNGNWFNK